MLWQEYRLERVRRAGWVDVVELSEQDVALFQNILTRLDACGTGRVDVTAASHAVGVEGEMVEGGGYVDAHDWMRWCAEKMHAVASERVNLAGFQHSLGAAALVSGVEVRSLLGVGAPERMSAYVSAESVVAHYVDVKLHSQPSGAFFINLRHFMKLRVTMDARWVLVKGRAAIEANKTRGGHADE